MAEPGWTRAPYSDKDMWGRVCALRNKRRCIKDYGIPKDMVYHPVIILGRRLVGTYRCMVVRYFAVEPINYRVDYLIRITSSPPDFLLPCL